MPVLKKYDADRVPPQCFDLPEIKGPVHRLVEDPYAPPECSGEDIPSWEVVSHDMRRWEEFSTMKYDPDTSPDVLHLFLADYNVQEVADQYLWPITKDDLGSYGRAPCGGEASCRGNRMNSVVDCFVTVTDCDFDGPDHDPTVLRVYRFKCSGTVGCDFVGKRPEECCVPEDEELGPLENEGPKPTPVKAYVESLRTTTG